MDKVSEAKTEFRIKQWTNIIQSCQTSGMTVVSWCSQNNINIKSYYYWLRKLRALACETETLPVVKKEQAIVPLSIKPANMTSAVITIHMSAASIDIRQGTSRETIEAVLSALKAIC